MSKVTIPVVCLTLCVITGVLGLVGQGSYFPQPVSARTVNGPGQVISKVSYASDTSPYDGTYAGAFYYDYRERIPRPGAPAGSGSYDLSAWTAASLNLTVTFQTPDGFSEQSASSTGHWLLRITRIIASDKSFGTGLDGIAPDYISTVIPGAGSTAQLPAVGGTGNGLLAQVPKFIQVAFPNGSYFRTSNVKDDLQVGFAQSTLSGSTWYALAGTSGALSSEPVPGTSGTLAPRRYEVDFKSWSLKKVPSSATTTTNTPTTASSKASTLKDVSGVVDVYSRKSGEWGWVTYKDGAFLDGASLMPGDRIATGSNGRVTLQMADGETITLGPDTQLFMSMEWFSDHHLIIMNVGKFRYWHNKATSPNVGATQISVDDVVIVGKGTDFTVEVDTARTITVMVFEGAVSVTDTKSKNGITLIANQRLSIPKNQAGLIQQDMLRRVNYLPPESVDRWWEKASASGLAQSPAWYPVVHPDGSLSIGKVEVISVGSRLTASGFVMTFVLAGAVLFLVAGQVFAWQLRRRYGKTTSP